MSLFHINSCSLSKNIEDLEYLLNSTSINFDVIAISETRIVKFKTPVNSLNLMNYSDEFCPTESLAGVHFYTCAITFHINLEMIYLFINLIEISNSKRSNIIIGCIYRHPNMGLDEFNDNYFKYFA